MGGTPVKASTPRRGGKRESLSKAKAAKAAAAEDNDSDNSKDEAEVEASTPSKRVSRSPTARKPRTKKAKKADGAAPKTTSGSAAVSASARRRAKQKDRVRALRAAAGVPEPSLDSNPELVADIREALHEILAAIPDTDSISPFRAPRVLSAKKTETYPDWSALIPATRAVVWDEAGKHKLQVLVDGEIVPAGQKPVGPIRVRKGEAF